MVVVLDVMFDNVRVFRGWLFGSGLLGGWLLLVSRVFLVFVGVGGV